MIKEEHVQPKEYTTILGVVMDTRLKLRQHIAEAASKGLEAAMELKRLRGLSARTARQLFAATVTPIVDYNPTSGCTKDRLMGPINRVQRAGAQAIVGTFMTVAASVAEAEAHIVSARERFWKRAIKMWVDVHTLPETNPLSRITRRIKEFYPYYSSPLHQVAKRLKDAPLSQMETITPISLENKQVRDCVSDTDICILTDGPTSIQRRAPSMEQLYKQPFTCFEGACGTVKLEDCGLEKVSVVKSAGVYICRVLLKIDSDDFMTQSDSSVARTMRKLHLLETIEDYAQQTLSKTENEYILPPYTSRRNRICILDELEWNISKAPVTATHNGEEVDLSTRVFAGPVTLSLPNRYWDILQEDESEFTAIENFEIRVDGGSLRDILLAIQQQNERMDAAAGEKHRHCDELDFEGLQRHDDHTWWVNIAK